MPAAAQPMALCSSGSKALHPQLRLSNLRNAEPAATLLLCRAGHHAAAKASQLRCQSMPRDNPQSVLT